MSPSWMFQRLLQCQEDAKHTLVVSLSICLLWATLLQGNVACKCWPSTLTRDVVDLFPANLRVCLSVCFFKQTRQRKAMVGQIWRESCLVHVNFCLQGCVHWHWIVLAKPLRSYLRALWSCDVCVCVWVLAVVGWCQSWPQRQGCEWQVDVLSVLACLLLAIIYLDRASFREHSCPRQSSRRERRESEMRDAMAH